ncbi:MAG: NAD(P)/FAD-dependent oxidoreductase [Pseudomonadota bacterium]|nr:NAD(P)/FAD-dependent oxidoreductase [Pseudomonadota bacterium]
MDNNSDKIYDVIILGAGISGLGMAHNLLKEKKSSFAILERNEGVGGTWRENTYPGLCCDVPSHFYSFSFAMNPDWSKTYPEQYEILDYLENITDRLKIRPFIKFNSEVIESKFNEVENIWETYITTGEVYKSRSLVSGLGQLNKPKFPEIDGLETFSGHAFHSAQWDHGYDLSNKRVAVIGNGPSAIGFIPKIADSVKKMVIFQRSPNWIVPKPDRIYGPFERFCLRYVPLFARMYRFYWYVLQERNYLAFYQKHNKITEFIEKAISAIATRFQLFNFEKVYEAGAYMLLDEQVEDEEFKKKLIPDYPIGCKRIIPTNDYFPALCKDNVELETSLIDKIEGNEIITKDGKRHEVDTIIYGTGFDTNIFISPVKITGIGNAKLDEAWKDGAEAYRGVMVPNFPNFYICYGPNTNTGHVSIIYMIESQLLFIMKCLKYMRKNGLEYIDIKDEAMKNYNQLIQGKLEETVWAASCGSWYKTEEGKIINNYPGYGIEYHWMMARPKYQEFNNNLKSNN